MSIITYPLNGVVYSAEDVGTYLCTRTSGVYSKESNFAVSITGTRQITVAPGLAWINYDDFKGVAVCSREENILTVPDADNTLNRVDRVVLQFDTSENVTAIKLKTGTPAVAAQPPDILQNHNQYELGLCTISVPAGSSAVTIADITDTRADETVCGVMRDGVTGIPTAQLQAQIAALLAQLRQSITNVDKQGFYSKEEVDTLLNALQEQVSKAVVNVGQPIAVWSAYREVSVTSYSAWSTTVPDDVDFIVIKKGGFNDNAESAAIYRGQPATGFPMSVTFSAAGTLTLAPRGNGFNVYCIGYHYVTQTDGLKVPIAVGSAYLAKNATSTQSCVVDSSAEYAIAKWTQDGSTYGDAVVPVSHSVIVVRGNSALGRYYFSGNRFYASTVGGDVYVTFYRYATLDDLTAQQTATQSAQADTDAMTVDQEYRLSLLELGITDETT